jgi:hypothetical protein
MSNWQLVRKPSADLQKAVEARQGLPKGYVERNLKDPRGDRIYWIAGKRGPSFSMHGYA